MRDPREITEQLDSLVSSAEQTERGVKDMEDLLSTDQDFVAVSGLGMELAEEEPEPVPTPPPSAARGAGVPSKAAVVPPSVSPPPPPRKKIPQ
jgi:hypothetical protein